MPGTRHNPFAIADVEGLTDVDLEDRVAIYRGLRSRLLAGAPSPLGVLEDVEAALALLEAEVVRRVG